MRLRVYVAGPISKGDLRSNINQARDAMLRLMRAGFAPYCPHLSAYLGGDEPEALPCGTTLEDWYTLGEAMVRGCHILLRLPGESVGADREMEVARMIGMPIYTSLDRLIEVHGKTTTEVDSGANRR